MSGKLALSLGERIYIYVYRCTFVFIEFSIIIFCIDGYPSIFQFKFVFIIEFIIFTKLTQGIYYVQVN